MLKKYKLSFINFKLSLRWNETHYWYRNKSSSDLRTFINILRSLLGLEILKGGW